ncbi:D-alanyl-D-alanine dipeptidase [Desulfocucumis palustris]|uniref:D-alanyl-D-alanine dipeptidase n=1 Tax=Desulfocucumis palustris TaxID=1898651 RepID=A0A2L2XLL8_9FIRM|nr:D-alanyl-D-alanine dipeptidase [Desulfocucumis palustris]GBF34851.1 D-alanyl-D-alanine dipeptidase [Desulfocucumis palustris]
MKKHGPMSAAAVLLAGIISLAVLLFEGYSPPTLPVEKTGAPPKGIEYSHKPPVGNASTETGIAKTPKDPPEKPVIINGLVELKALDDSFVIDLKYAGRDNFTGEKIYTLNKCIIHQNTAAKLIKANNDFKQLGYRIKIFDAYRPYSAQKKLWDAARDKTYLASPQRGSKHNRGAAVDITLVDNDGKELAMPSGFDEFTERAHINYRNCPDEQIKNRELLANIMLKHGFKRISTEWWHFEDTDAMKYPLLDIPFEAF